MAKDIIKAWKDMTPDEQKAFLGDEFSVIEKARAAEAAKAQQEAIIKAATVLVQDGGKYYATYSGLEAKRDEVEKQLQSIWEKAQLEARESLGLPAPEPKKEKAPASKSAKKA